MTNDRLDILRNRIRKVFCPSDKDKDRYSANEFCHELCSKLKHSSTKLEDLEVIITHWGVILKDSLFMSLVRPNDRFFRWSNEKTFLCKLFSVTTLYEIDFKNEIENSNLTEIEKEYLKLKYFT